MSAYQIIRVAMGKRKSPDGRRSWWIADDDPLAAWCGVEAIIDMIRSVDVEA